MFAEHKLVSIKDVQENAEIVDKAKHITTKGVRKLDALHIACAIFSQCKYFLTTDDKVLKKGHLIEEIKIVDPFLFIKETDEL